MMELSVKKARPVKADQESHGLSIHSMEQSIIFMDYQGWNVSIAARDDEGSLVGVVAMHQQLIRSGMQSAAAAHFHNGRENSLQHPMSHSIAH